MRETQQQTLSDLLTQVETERRRAAWWKHRARIWKQTARFFRRQMHAWRKANDQLRDASMRLKSAEALLTQLRTLLGAGERENLLIVAARLRQERADAYNVIGLAAERLAALDLEAVLVPGTDRQHLRQAVQGVIDEVDALRAALDEVRHL